MVEVWQDSIGALARNGEGGAFADIACGENLGMVKESIRQWWAGLCGGGDSDCGIKSS